MSELSKITDRHGRRRAVVYVRQSTPGRSSATPSPRPGSTRSPSGQSSWGGQPRRSSSLMRTRASRADGRTPGSGSASSRPRSVLAMSA
jgi:hypothetical protein